MNRLMSALFRSIRILSAHLAGARRNAILAFAVTLAGTASFFLGFGKSNLYERDLRFGADLLLSQLPATPGYPMWGYPVLAAILGDALIFVQMLFLAALLPLIIDLALPQIQANTRLARVAATSVVLVILFPWIWLSLGYNSSAMLSLLMVSGFVVLVRLPEREHPLTQCAIAGLFFGLAYNFRTEALATAVLVTVAILVRGLATGLWRRALKMAAAFVGVVAAFAAPYVVYTTFVLGVPRLATTNRGAALYFQLGVLPKNPWKIVPNDSFAASEAWEFTDDGPFSLVADEIFTERFRRAVATHPRSFAARALAGLKLCLQRGLYWVIR